METIKALTLHGHLFYIIFQFLIFKNEVQMLVVQGCQINNGTSTDPSRCGRDPRAVLPDVKRGVASE